MFDLRTQSADAPGGMIGFIARFVLRFLQLILGITVIGLYATDLNAAHKVGAYSDSKWGFAVAVAVMSCVTVLIYAIPIGFVKNAHLLFGWDLILFILWTAVFGLFGNMYIKEDAEGNGGIKRMKSAVWVDLINMLLWLVTAVLGAVYFFWTRRRSLHTGRAQV